MKKLIFIVVYTAGHALLTIFTISWRAGHQIASPAWERLYDLVVAMTNGGPGIASEVPAKFVMDHLFNRANVGLATACATVMLITVIVVLAPWLYAQYGPSGRRAR